MRNQNWRFFCGMIAVVVVAVFIASFATLAAAQTLDKHAILAAAPKVSTSVSGVEAFLAPGKDFNPLTATSQELLSYGLPTAPDKSDAKAYEHWTKAMLAVQSCSRSAQTQGRTTSAAGQACHGTDVKAKPYSSREMMPSGAATANVDGTTSYTSSNWSGIAQTNKNKSWSAKTSFDEVVSVWNVPVANHPFGNIPCAEGPWFAVTWNGIDGFSNGDVVQGGSAEYWDGGGCEGPIEYYGWVEWYPSYPILTIYCGSSPCPVGPGDDFYVITYGAAGTAEQFVYVEDITQQWYGTFGLVYVTGPGLVGSSAEYIVERPCCNGSNLFPLGNYVYEFFDYSFAYDGNGTLFYPGSSSATTAIITMQADEAAGYADISYPFFYGTAGNQGRYSIWLADENCAFSGGCAVGP